MQINKQNLAIIHIKENSKDFSNLTDNNQKKLNSNFFRGIYANQ